MAGLIRVGLEPATVARAAEQIADASAAHARREAKKTADRTAVLMNAEMQATGEDGMKDPTGEYVGTVVAGVEREGDGYRAFLTVEGDERDRIKARIIEYGRGEKDIYPRTRKAMSWADAEYANNKAGDKVFAKKVTLKAVEGKHVMRRVRDRVYQRIRRGTV